MIKLPSISVVVSNYNGKKFLKACISSVLGEPGNNYEVVFVDDGSTDESVSYVKKLFGINKKLRIIALPENRGTVTAVNTGVKHSRGRIVFLLNNDAILEKGWVKPIISFFEKYKKAAAAQAKILRVGTKIYDYAGDFIGPFGFLIERAQNAIDKGQFDQIDKIFSLRGTAMIARRDLYLKLGGFDNDYRFGWDETDLTWRMWLAGYEIYFLPQVLVYHAYNTKAKPQEYYDRHRIYYYGCRDTIATHIKNLSTKHLFTILPLNVLCWFALSLGFFATLKFHKGWELTKAIFWNITHITHTLKKRAIIQGNRKISDDYLFSLVGSRRNIKYYFLKAVAYLQNKPF